MSEETAEDILGKASAMEKEYEWLQASEYYEQALGMVDEGDNFRRGEVQEKSAYCLQRLAFQAESRDDFLNKIRKSIEAYTKAIGFYNKLAAEKKAWAIRCNAIAKYLEFWLVSDPAERRNSLRKSLELEAYALNSFLEMKEKYEYCRLVNDLSNVPFYLGHFEWDDHVKKDSLEKGISWGEKSIEILSEEDNFELARTYIALTQNFDLYHYFYEEDVEKRNQINLQTIKYSDKLVEYAEKSGDTLTIGQAHCIKGKRENTNDEAISHYLKGLEGGEETNDIFLKATSYDSISYQLYWKAYALEDPDERSKLAKKAMLYYDKAQHLFAIINFQIPIPGKLGAPTPGGYVEYYWDRSRWETDFNKKRELLEEAERLGLKALQVVEDLDIPIFIGRVYHVLSGALSARARLESDHNIKESYLLRALDYREKNIQKMKQLIPYHYWNQGVYYNLLALTQQELASIQPDHSSKISLLEDAGNSARTSLELIYKVVPFWSSESNVWEPFCRYQSEYAVILKNLYNITENHENLRKAIKIWHEAIESASKLNLVTYIAEFYWEIAKAQVVLGEHAEAADNFKRSSENYEYAVEKIPQLKEFYKDYALYMQAWSEFEKAKQHHAEKRYLIAKDHYEKAAELHKSTERWTHLAPNYLAWARLEEAEDLSRREETEKARDLFQRATGLFKEAKGSIEIKLRTIQDEEERELLVSLTQASDMRREYCLGRTALEEARILDRQGDHLSSSRSYGSASETFKGIVSTSEEAQEELQPLICLCQAWQKMTQAEAEASPNMYLEASQHFEKAKDHSVDEKSKRLALGHSRFCRALEAGARFEDKNDIAYYNEAIKHLESAARHYVRAGFKSASDYAKATRRLFDAYVYMDSASKETEPQKKARYYTMAERVLETSAGNFLTAKHPEKSKEVERLLNTVRVERELAASLSEVLHAPTIVSTTEAFTIPSPTREEAVGLERFKSADIQANLILGSGELKVGDDLNIEIELVNAGKAPAQLIKVEEIIPEGFEVRSAPDICRVEDSYIDLKGRALSPLKTEELKLVLKPLNKGTFNLRPRILYLDESGKYKHHEPEPAIVEVRELGIKGWLRGPTR